MKSRRQIFSYIACFLCIAMLSGTTVVVPFAAPVQSGNVQSPSDASDVQSPSDADSDQRFAGGMKPPPIEEIDSRDEWKAWYEEAVSSGREAFGRLTEDIILDSSWHLEESANYITLETGEHKITVPDGCTLTIDNPRLFIIGEDVVLRVMMGGRAELLQGTLQGIGPKALSVLAYAPSSLIVNDAFSVGTIWYVNESPVATPPEGMKREILNIFEPAPICMTAGSLPGLPDTVAANVMAPGDSGSHERLWLPIHWQTEDIDFKIPAELVITGTLPEEALAERKLKNPKNLTRTIQVLVQNPGPIQQFSGRIMRVNGSGDNRIMTMRFDLPLLSSEVTGVYLEQSPDGVLWSRVNNPMGSETDSTNFLEQIQFVGIKGFLACRIPAQGSHMYFRLEVQGSEQEGWSNVVTIEVPEDGKKPEQEPDSEEDGSSEGNRGGVGQEEADRVIPGTEEQGPGVLPGESLFEEAAIEVRKQMIELIPTYGAEPEITETEEQTEAASEEDIEPQTTELLAEMETITEQAAEVTTMEPNVEREKESGGSNAPFPPSAGAVAAAITAAVGILGVWFFRKHKN